MTKNGLCDWARHIRSRAFFDFSWQHENTTAAHIGRSVFAVLVAFSSLFFSGQTLGQDKCLEWRVDGGSYPYFFPTQDAACRGKIDFLNVHTATTYETCIQAGVRIEGYRTYSLITTEGACHFGVDGPCRDYTENAWPYSGRWVTPCPAQIEILGRSSTKALPAGPALPLTAKVTRNGSPVYHWFVTVKLEDGKEVTGNTNEQGEFRFNYIPPYRPTIDQITATCSNCANTAEKTITVEACDACEDNIGNPISASTGDKLQAETDWEDAGAHPLSFTRHYRSSGNVAARLGPRWSHDFATTAVKLDLHASVRFGDGRKVLFTRTTMVSPWVAENGRDSLTESPQGMTYIRAADESNWLFDSTGRLLSIRQRNGWAMTLAYDAANQLATVTNAFGRALQFAHDGAGHLIEVTTPEGRQVRFSFDGNGRLSGATYPDGKSRQYHYEDARWPAALTGITNEAGERYASFSYDGSGRALSTTHAGVQTYSVSYAVASPATIGSITGGEIDSSLYQLSGQVSDPLGNSRSYTWQGGDGQVRLASANAAFEGGQVALRSFGGANLPAIETDFMGVSTAYTWDLGRQLKTATTRATGRPEAQTTQTQWHPTFRLPALVTEAGRTTAYSYDSLGNKLSETITDSATGQSRTWAWTYSDRGLPETMTDAKGGVWRYGYDAAGNRTSIKNPLGQQTSYSFDAAGRVLSETEPNGLVTSYSYDARGRLVSLNRGGEVSGFSYTPTGQLSVASLPNGYSVSYSYDAAQRLTGAADNRGNRVSYTLDAMGNRTREEVRDATGAIVLVTGRIIDNLNKVAAIQGSLGQTTALSYDANGEPIAQTDPLNQTTRQSLDARRRPTTTTFADNTSASQAWNQLDQLTQVSDPKGVQTSYQTNAFGEVMRESSPDIGAMTYTRDANGEVTSVQDAKGSTSAITRDALGRPVEIRHAPDHIAYFSYDQGQAGYLDKIEDKSGSTRYERDAHGRVTAKTQTVNDNPANPTQLKVGYGYQGGQLASITYPSGLKVFYRRLAGRITGIDVQEPAGTSGKTPAVTPFVTDLTHTALGQPRSWAWKNGDSASRSFDADGRMTQSEIATYSYDAASRITGITQSLWAQRTVRAVVNGKPQTTTELYQTPITWTAGYDARNRLTSFARAGASTAYTYDANSNRLTAIDQTTSEIDLEGAFDQPNFTQSNTQNLAIDSASNKLLGFTQTVTRTQAGGTPSSVTSQVNYNLDANGAMTSDGLRTFEYDESRRLSKVKVIKDGEAAAVHYLHNALGQRVFKSEPQAEQTLPNEEDLEPGFINWLRKQFGWLFAQGNASKASIGMAFVYADDEIPEWALLGEYDNGSAIGKGRTEYVWLPTEDGYAIPIGLYKNGKFYQVHSDHLGTPRLITDVDKKPTWQWPYSTFGNNKVTGVLAMKLASGAVTLKATKAPVDVNLRFPGQYFDEESNLSYNYQRSYQAMQGRYTQPDPLGLGGGSNRFDYLARNPLRSKDPLGLYSANEFLEDFSNFSAGFGDTFSFNLTKYIREAWDVDGANYCSPVYSAGVITEMIGELILTGGSMALGRLAAKTGSRAAQASARAGKDAFRKANGLTGGEVHHNHPLIGHPGGGTTLFPTGGLPAWFHSGAWNLSHTASRAEHMAMHQYQQRLERMGAALVNPVAMGARASRAGQCTCN